MWINEIQGGSMMPISLRIPSEKEDKIRRAAVKAGKTKTAFILEAVDEKVGLVKSRDRIVREAAGWLRHEEAEELRRAVGTFKKRHRGDWK
jgi:uncharacterized protein (DUF1778 family)